ncbi:MAG: hypothetical protein ABEJ99_01410 [Candidatus Nanohaloarchaea archaeon]
MKGQAAIEYMTVLGIALVLSAPFVIKAQGSILKLRSGSASLTAQDTLNDIEVAAETVSAAGEPATRTFVITIPNSVNSTSVGNRQVKILLNDPSGATSYSRSFSFNVTGSLPSSGGKYRLKTEAKNGGVNLQVVS